MRLLQYVMMIRYPSLALVSCFFTIDVFRNVHNKHRRNQLSKHTQNLRDINRYESVLYIHM
jgi:hypothetical protein